MHDAPRTKGCGPLVIADSPLGSVTICPDCGMINLSASHLRLRMSVEAFDLLADMLAQARSRLGEASPGSARAPAALPLAGAPSRLH